eukprot:scaffold4304_cov71-Cylindrotheca_fusiformis.AAC.1
MVWPSQVIMDGDDSSSVAKDNERVSMKKVISRFSKNNKNKKRFKEEPKVSNDRSSRGSSVWPSALVLDNEGNYQHASPFAPQDNSDNNMSSMIPNMKDGTEKKPVVGTTSWPSLVFDTEPSFSYKIQDDDELQERSVNNKRQTSITDNEVQPDAIMTEPQRGTPPVGILRPSKFPPPCVSASMDTIDSEASLETYESYDSTVQSESSFLEDQQSVEPRKRNVAKAFWQFTTRCYMPHTEEDLVQ